jgi:hypothetical protein
MASGAARKSEGVRPRKARKGRVWCAWSAKPARNAASETFEYDAFEDSKQRSRFQSECCRGRNPVLRVISLERRSSESPTCLASSGSFMLGAVPSRTSAFSDSVRHAKRRSSQPSHLGYEISCVRPCFRLKTSACVDDAFGFDATQYQCPGTRTPRSGPLTRHYENRIGPTHGTVLCVTPGGLTTTLAPASASTKPETQQKILRDVELLIKPSET